MALLTNINGKFSVSDAGAVTFNNAFTFPTADGTANYVLKTNGSGQLAWGPDNNGGDITGSGTANTVTKFTGAKTIGDGPITFSSNDSIFAGNVGINETSLTEKLEVNGAIVWKGALTTSKTSAGVLDRSGDSLRIRAYGATAGSGNLHFRTGGGAAQGDTLALTIDSSQNATFAENVTIGDNRSIISNGSVRIDIDNDNDSTTRAFIVRNDGGTNELFRVQENGNVGIGTDSPNFKVDIVNAAANTAVYQQFRNGTTGTASSDGTVMGIDSDGDFLINNQEAKEIKLYTSDSQRLTIQSGGNVGIGTDSPGFKLDIRTSTPGDRAVLGVNSATSGTNYGGQFNSQGSGATKNVGLYATAEGATTNYAAIFDSGNVGIGTTTPSEILQTNKNSAGNIVGGYFTNSQANTGAESVSLAFGLNRSGGDFVRQVKAITFGAEQQWTGTESTVDGYLSFSTISNETVAEKIRITSAGNIQFAQDGYINTNTADASDNLSLQLSGGGAFGDTRGACIALAGNENGNGGLIQLRAGQGQYSEVRTYTSGAERTRVENNGDFILYGGRLYLNSGTGYNNTGYIYLSNGRTAIESNIVNLTANGDTSLNFKTRSGGATSSAMYINEFRNVGIGTDSPSRELDIQASSGWAEIALRGNTGGGGSLEFWTNTTKRAEIFADTEDIVFRNTPTNQERMRITSAGNVGIGTTSPTLGKLQVVNNSQSISALTICNEANGGDGFVFQKWQYVESTSNFRLDLKQRVTSGVVQYAFDMVNNGTGYTSVLVLDRGKVGIGDTTPSYKLDVTGTIRATGDVIAYSDVRIKENIKTIDNSLEKVSKLRGVEFNKIGDNKKSIGVIAQEIEKVIPEVVKEDDKGMKSVAYGNISGLLIEAIKELKAEIEELKKHKCDCKR